jgi:hypothetical protein
MVNCYQYHRQTTLIVVAILLFDSSVIMLGASYRYHILSSTPSPAISAISGDRVAPDQTDNADRIEALRKSPESSLEDLPNTAVASDHPVCSKVCPKRYLTATL